MIINSLMNLSAFILSLTFGIIAIFLFRFAIRILRSDPNLYERNRRLSKSLQDSFTGRIEQWSTTTERNPIALSGLAVENGKLVPRGRLSDDAVLDIIG